MKYNAIFNEIYEYIDKWYKDENQNNQRIIFFNNNSFINFLKQKNMENFNQNFVQKKETNGVAIAGLITSIVALICSPIPLLCWILWIVGLILSCVGLGKKTHKKLAVGGLLISIINFIVLIVMLFVGVAAVADTVDEMNKPEVETVVDSSVNNEWDY